MRPPLFRFACLCLLSIAPTTLQAADPAKADTLAALRAAASRVPAWAEQKDLYRRFNAVELYGLIDGGAVEYQKQGLIGGIFVSLTKGARLSEIYLEDFGSPARAVGMVEIKRQSFNAAKGVPGLEAVAAVYVAVIGGCVVYWAKGAYYFEMTLTGYDSSDDAARDTVILVTVMSAAIPK